MKLTLRCTWVVVQFSEANRGRLGTEDSVDILEESGPDNPGGATCTISTGPKNEEPS